MSTEIDDFYAYLGVSPAAGRAEIDAAYRARMRVVHPDAAATDAADAERRHLATVKLNLVAETLRSESKRRAYDRDLAQAIRHRNDREPDPLRPQSRPEPEQPHAPEPPRRPSRARGSRTSGRSMRVAWRMFREARSRRAIGCLAVALGAWLLASVPGQWFLLGAVVVLSGQPVFWHLTGTTSAVAAFGDGLIAWVVVIGVYTRALPRPVVLIASLLLAMFTVWGEER